ncbi:type IV pilus secretin PilQ family protein [Acinetobacter nectaris]|uniref:type IV pilus secretin PilQ family protein n=1 Tax=Acinetobacter nectaris TaxID=1219382 RepID=UPI001F462DAA|nr:type IV pilus secretin PilQ family protein [Acinetobacter nectaris]MCF9033525.1 type IV pilus secretin PilQ family protein [Acinetobacter nectaris]
MNSICRRFLLSAAAVAVMQTAQASVAVIGIVPVQVANQGTEIRIMFNGLPPQPKAYQVQQSSQLILDFPETTNTTAQSQIPFSNEQISALNVSSDNARTRLSLDLKQNSKFSTRVEGNTYILRVLPTTSPVQQVSTPQAVLPYAAQGISNIGFQRNDKGDGQIIIDLSNPKIPVDIQQRNNKIIARFTGNKIPMYLARRLNVNDFATPVSIVDSFNDGNNGVIEIQASDSFDYMAYQADNKLTINVSKKLDSTQRAMQATKYSGKKISLDFQDIEVRKVLQLLADFSNENLVAADSVQGNITLHLKDVPVDQALALILQTKNLDQRRTGNVIWIAPTSDMIKRDEEQAKLYAQSIKLAPLQTEYVQLNYAKASDIQKLISATKKSSGESKDPLSGSDDNSGGSLLSPRGTISVDDRTNTIIINDTATKITQIQQLLKQLDIPVKQVMVEARIVRASTDFSKSIGVKWGYFGRNGAVTNGTSTRSTGTLVGSSISNVNTLRNESKVTNNLNVDLGSTLSNSPSIAFGLLNTADTLLSLELSALQSDGLGEVLSTPKVMTGDKQEAIIKSGAKIPYATTSANNGTTTTFQDAVLELKVTPSITPDGKVQMKLNISKDTLGLLTDAGYAIDTNTLQTNVLVNNGETVVLGGLYENSTSNNVSKVPLLGDIPGLGNLFKNRTRTEQKRELLIFITPRIVNDTFSRNH